MLGSNHVFTRLSEYEKQAQAWLTLDERMRANDLLVQLLQASFTVGNENERRGRLPRYWLEAVAFGGRKSSLILAAALSGSNASGGFAFV